MVSCWLDYWSGSCHYGIVVLNILFGFEFSKPNKIFVKRYDRITYGFIMIGSIMFIFGSSLMNFCLLGCGIILLICLFTLSYLRKKHAFPVLISLTSARNRFLIEFPLGAIMIISIIKVPVDYFYVTILIIVLAITIPVLFVRKYLAINSSEIRCSWYWSAKWDEIIECNIDDKEGTLRIKMRDNVTKLVTGISPRYCVIISENIDKYFTETRPNA